MKVMICMTLLYTEEMPCNSYRNLKKKNKRIESEVLYTSYKKVQVKQYKTILHAQSTN